jgi:phage-related protein
MYINMGIWSWAKSTASKIGHAIGNAFSSGKKAVSSVAHAVGSTIKTVYSDAKAGVKGYAKGVSSVVNKVVDDTVGKDGIINKTVGGVTGILSTPLLLLAGGGAAFLAFSGRNSGVNASVSR